MTKCTQEVAHAPACLLSLPSVWSPWGDPRGQLPASRGRCAKTLPGLSAELLYFPRALHPPSHGAKESTQPWKPPSKFTAQRSRHSRPNWDRVWRKAQPSEACLALQSHGVPGRKTWADSHLPVLPSGSPKPSLKEASPGAGSVDGTPTFCWGASGGQG